MSRTFRFQGAVGLVTGAGGGIGAALALELARRGCALMLVDRDADGLARTARAAAQAGAAVETAVIDLVDAAAIRALPEAVAARFGGLDLLVNNAGVALGGRFADTHLDDFEWLMDVNLRAVVRLCHAFLPMLTARPAAQIVNVSSVFGLIGVPEQVAYCTSKFAVRGFSEALRHEYAGTGLGVSVVHPGGVATAIARNARNPRLPDDPVAAEAARLAIEAGRVAFEKFLTLAPERAAAEIARGIERRAPRILIGRDARNIALIQRLMPAGYWGLIARLSAGRT
ncbi:SDR family NAD(P)-dependent oxidoreductase [Methylobacterium sp. NEAU 140]|uniref:SDR family NAD(P)-dependent oxidoreductase n=1 Tax=Methylobacterium sp. NEAU 140 TaxID=3064945 RepID=UPI002736F113|nr:SDR family NAD(P)-dependent oxidoreductase [Methylobacterium sp. NEAU 140]MDP4026025.1 SDR family NAD(P)-dependent oxidoreductase [Methylobacterium sp. NEAU 140]